MSEQVQIPNRQAIQRGAAGRVHRRVRSPSSYSVGALVSRQATLVACARYRILSGSGAASAVPGKRANEWFAGEDTAVRHSGARAYARRRSQIFGVAWSIASQEL